MMLLSRLVKPTRIILHLTNKDQLSPMLHGRACCYKFQPVFQIILKNMSLFLLNSVQGGAQPPKH